jgi:hypothetical protein
MLDTGDQWWRQSGRGGWESIRMDFPPTFIAEAIRPIPLSC